MRLEVDTEIEACERILTELHVTNLKIVRTGEKGWPDRVFLIPGGRPLLIEFKREKDGALSEHQILKIRRLKKLKYDVEVCDTVEQAMRVVCKALERAKCQ